MPRLDPVTSATLPASPNSMMPNSILSPARKSLAQARGLDPWPARGVTLWHARRFCAKTDMGEVACKNLEFYGGVALILALMALAVPASALTRAEIFTVSVPVDATAASATAARDTARLDGQRRAFAALLDRLTLAKDRGRLPSASDTMLNQVIIGFEVANERRSTVRYLADYTFHFRPDVVEQLLRDRGVVFRRDGEQAGRRAAGARDRRQAAAVGRSQSLARGLVERQAAARPGADEGAARRGRGCVGDRRREGRCWRRCAAAGDLGELRPCRCAGDAGDDPSRRRRASMSAARASSRARPAANRAGSRPIRPIKARARRICWRAPSPAPPHR